MTTLRLPSLSEVRDALGRREPQLALTFATKWLAERPGDPEVLECYLECVHAVPSAKERVAALEAALEQFAAHPRLLEAYGQALHTCGESNAALQTLRSAADAFPEDAALTARTALQELLCNEEPQALGRLEAKPDLLEHSPEICAIWGAAEAVNGRLDKAHPLLKSAWAMGDRSPTTAVLLGSLSSGDGQLTLPTGQTHTSTDADAWLLLGKALAAQSRHDEALVAYRNGVETGLISPYALLAESTSLEQAGRYEDAEKAVRAALRQDGELTIGWLQYGALRLGAADLDTASACFAKALELQDDHPLAAAGAALCLVQRGEFMAATALLAPQAERALPEPMVAVSWGWLCRILDHTSAALPIFEKCLSRELRSDEAELLYRGLSRTYRVLGEAELAGECEALSDALAEDRLAGSQLLHGLLRSTFT